MDRLIRENIDKLSEVFKTHYIEKAYLFGSAASNNVTDESDIDFLVSFNEYPFDGYADNLWDMEDQLEKILNKKVDVVPEHTLRNPYFIKSVNKNRILIYG
ncbi:nucleotidyltransferase family protein [Bacteroidota bacterium]